jgi:hypothetical protein
MVDVEAHRQPPLDDLHLTGHERAVAPGHS